MKLACSLLLALTFILPSRGFAQDAQSSDDIVASTQNDILLVGAAGLGGAVIGLSTLSFYDKPSQSLGNIWTGAAIGIIAGVIIVALGHAQKTQDNLTTYSPKTTPEFSTAARGDWHFEHINSFSNVSSGMSSQVWSASF